MTNICAKGIFNENSCFDYNNLKTISLAYNKYNLNHNKKNYISGKIIDSKDYELLLKELKRKLNCKNDMCILNQTFIKHVNNQQIIYQRFKPEGPLDKEWLSNWNIDQEMLRFQNYYNCLLYTGTVSIDFNQKKMYNIYKNVFHEKSHYNKMPCFYYYTNKCTVKNNNKINCIATIYNTAKRSEPGQHWIATFIKRTNDGTVKMYFFDSVGIKPPKEINNFLKYLEKHLFYKSKNIEKKYNNVQHQYKNSECGVYCIDFIDNMTSDSNSFDTYIDKKTTDDAMNEKRKLYFRAES